MTDQLIMTTAERDKQYAALENSIDAVTQEITDHKAMWGEEAIPSRVAQRQNLVLKEREHKDAMEMLQSLPMVSAEPVATVKSWTNGSYWRNYKLDWNKDVPEGTKLYTSPQAPTQISTDDVTDEMVKKFLETTPFCDGTVKESIAAAYNAVIENRSEAR